MPELSEEETILFNKLAKQVVARGMGTPAILFLETSKPLGFVASQVMVFFRPFVQMVISDPVNYETLRTSLERRGTIEELIKCIEKQM